MSNMIKVSIATGLVLIVVAGLLFSNHRTAQKASEISIVIGSQSFPSLNALHDMRYGVSRIVSSVNELLVLSASRVQTTEESMVETEQIEFGRKLFESSFQRFTKGHASLHHTTSDQHDKLLKDIQNNYRALNEMSALISEISLGPFEAETVAELKEIFEIQEMAVLRSIETLLSITKIENESLVKKEMNAVGNMELQTILLGGIFFIVLVTYSIFVLNALSSETSARKATEQAVQEKLQEMTLRIKLEKSLAHSRKLESLGTLAGGVAHELNNQLLPVMTMAELLYSRLDDKDSDHRKLEIILKGTEQARNTVSKILKFSRSGEGVEKACNPQDICLKTEDVLNAACPANMKLSISVEPCDRDCLVQMAPDDLQGILVNLFSNSVDAIGDQQGEIAIECVQEDIEDNHLELQLGKGPHVKILVNDTGCGISPELAERIFDPFFTTKDAGKGVGLGMSIVHSTIIDANGNIFVESTKGKGATFTIYLPIKDALSDEGQTT